jgi:hypothetical protein
LSSRIEDAPQKPNRPSLVQDLERTGFRRPALPPTVYIVDGMGSPEKATVERTIGQRRRGLCSVSQRGAIPPICRHRHTGAAAKETPAMKDWKRPYLKIQMFQLVFILISVSVVTVCIRFCATKRNSAWRDSHARARGVARRASEEERACGAPLPSHTSTY